MAESGHIPPEAIAIVQLTYSSNNPILVDCIKQEPEEESQTEVLNLSIPGQPPPPPTPQPSQVPYPIAPHQVWAGVSPVVGFSCPRAISRTNISCQ